MPNPILTRPDFDDVQRELAAFHAMAGPRMSLHDIGRSLQDRPIPAVELTDPTQPAADKEHVFIVASQHGSEESGRAMVLELIRFLLSEDPQAREILRCMAIAVVPCASPDGAVAHTYRNAADVDVAHTFHRSEPAGTPEGRALEKYVYAFQPDVYIDVHGMAGGSLKDRVWLIPPLDFTPDRMYLTQIAQQMHAAAEAAGFPQCEVMPPGAFRGDQETIYLLGDKIAGDFKALCLGMETVEQYYREADWRADGLARFRALLAVGLEDGFGLGTRGFPTSLVSGSRIFGLKAHGATAASRRENRIALTQFLRRNFAMVDRGSDGAEDCAKVTVSSKTIDGPNPDRFALLLRIKKPCTVQTVSWEGRELAPGDNHGFRQWEDANSVLLQANLRAPFGGPDRQLTVRYRSPLLTDA
ncbi:MAG: M14 family zinc carboxypeptidase [Planctomycetota bacterium]